VHAGSVRGGTARALFKALRPRQWLKNLLVFVPMLAGHALDLPSFTASLVAFVAFSLCASSAYLLNDALDAQDDRVHPTKHARPIASGALSLPLALFASPLLALAAIALCAATNVLLLGAVLVYFISTVAYSVWLKRLLMIDIVALAILYSLRVIGGAAATGIPPSFWLLAFSFFIFLSLALLKRHSELINLHKRGKDKTRGRGYTVEDRMPVGVMGVNSAFLSVLVFMLYFNSENVLDLYRTPVWLAGILPLLVFWLGRLWALSFRGQVNEDPVLYVSKDKTSLAVVACCLALATLATF
jgi:4-hydroxybenzoate polyprenyltransferase